jgi:hypothetical protein
VGLSRESPGTLVRGSPGSGTDSTHHNPTSHTNHTSTPLGHFDLGALSIWVPCRFGQCRVSGALSAKGATGGGCRSLLFARMSPASTLPSTGITDRPCSQPPPIAVCWHGILASPLLPADEVGIARIHRPKWSVGSNPRASPAVIVAAYFAGHVRAVWRRAVSRATDPRSGDRRFTQFGHGLGRAAPVWRRLLRRVRA